MKVQLGHDLRRGQVHSAAGDVGRDHREAGRVGAALRRRSTSRQDSFDDVTTTPTIRPSSSTRTTSFDLRSARRHRGRWGPLPVWTGRSRRRAHRGEVHPAINGVGDQLQDRAVLGRPDQASTSPIRHSKQLGVQLTQQMASIRRVPHAVNRTASDHDSSASACRQGTPQSGPWGRVGGGTGSPRGAQSSRFVSMHRVR